jgi:VanZ family protein
VKRAGLVRVWTPAAAMAVLIFALSSLPKASFPPHPPLGDSLFHVAEFTVLAFLVARAMSRTLPGIRTLLAVALSFSFCVIYGMADELHQLWVPTRVFDLGDFVCDVLGGAWGAALFAGWHRFRHRAADGEGNG